MAYNGGIGLFRKRNMVTLIEEHRWLEVIGRLPTKGDPDRRLWREARLREAAAADPVETHDAH